MKKYEVVVSYYTNAGETLACLINERLKQRKINVFYDTETSGNDCAQESVLKIVDNCDDFIIVLPQHSLDECNSENDRMRKIIAYAIQKKKNIIPVVMRNFAFPESVPKDIEELRTMKSVCADIDYFEETFERIFSMTNTKISKALEKISTLTQNSELQARFAEGFEKVKTENTPESQYELAVCYNELNDKSYNEEMAKLFLQAANQNYAPAQNALGCCYKDGIGVERNIQKAVELLIKSMNQGFVKAYYNLAKCYELHYKELVLDLMERAAQQDYVKAVCDLGALYEEGKFVKYNSDKAREYYQRAYDMGETKLKDKLYSDYWAVKAIKRFFCD